MGKKSLKQILATLLAASMLAPTAAALSEQEDATPANPSTTIDAEVTAPSIEDLCLTEEFIAFLNQNNIPIIDGNVVPTTVKDFKNIVMYHQRALYTLGMNYSKQSVSEFVFILSLKDLTPQLIEDLISEGVITPESVGIEGSFGSIASDIKIRSFQAILNGTSNQGLTQVDMILNYKVRKMVYDLDKMVSEARECFISKDKEKFAEISNDLYLFLTGRKDLNGYMINEREDAYMNATFALAEIANVAFKGGMSDDSDLLQYYFNDTEDHYMSMKQVLDSATNIEKGKTLTQ